MSAWPSPRTLALALAGAGLLAGATAHAQAGGAAGAQRPPVRATATVEVIDVGHGVDDIISRVRAQQRAQAAPTGQPGGGRTGSTTTGAPTPPVKSAEARPQGDHEVNREAEELRAERPERPRLHSEREKHDGHHADRDLGRRVQSERIRESRK